MESTTSSAVGGGGPASMLVATDTDLLWRFLQTGRLNDPLVYSNLCLSLARGIDHALANNEVPSRSRDLPLLLKQVYRCKNLSFQAAFMVLMISIKNACKIGWFPDKETNDLLILVNEVGRNFSSIDDVNIEPSYALPYISNVISRFYPQMKIRKVLLSLEVKPGYGAFVADFHISRDMVAVAPQHEKIDNGPQPPTNVTAMLKYGINLLQAIGQFNGNYIIALATMSVISSSGTSEFQDYDQPVVDSDFGIIETSSRMSLNCPISQRRIKTPVKGHICKHPQCFDYDNFLAINSLQPSWRCPHCNQSVCLTDLCIDQNVLKVLREAGEDTVDVIISEDGSWKTVLENKNHSTQRNGTTQSSQQGGNEQCESSSTIRNENRELYQHNHRSLSTADNLLAPQVNNKGQTKEDLSSGIYHSISSVFCSSAAVITSLSTQNNILKNLPSNLVPSPVLTDAVSPAHCREPGHAHGITQFTTSNLQNQLFSPNDMQLQQSAFGSSSSSSEAGRLPSMVRLVSVCESAVQQLLAQAQVPSLCQITRANDTFMPFGASSGRSQTAPSMAPNKDGYDTFNRGTVREQQFPGLYMNVSDVASSLPQHHSLTQNWVDSDCHHISGQSVQQAFHLPPQRSGVYNGSTRPPSMQQSQHHLNTPNLRMTQSEAVNPSQNLVQASIPVQPMQVQQRDGIQHPESTRHSAFSLDMVAEKLRTAGVQTQNKCGPTQPIWKGDSSTAVASEQNWRPSGRMRGSLTGEAYSAALGQFMSQPSQPSRAFRPPSSLMPNLPNALPMHGLITSRANASHGSQEQTPPRP